MNGFEAIYGHLGASKLLNARKPPSPAPTTTNGVWWKQSEAKLPKHQQKAEQADEDGEDEFEDEVIEEMSGNWPPSSSTGVQAVVPRVDSVEWTKMEEGPDEENVVSAGDNDDSSPQRSAAQKALKRKRKPSPELKADGASGADQPAGKKRLSCIDCGCRAALKACSKVMCIDCCAKDSRVCDAHAKKLYDQATEKEASSSSSGSNKVKASAGTKPTKKKPKRDGSGPEDDGDEDSGEGSPERDADREVAAVAGEEVGGGKAKRSALYETIAKQDRKIRALQNDLKELRTLLLSVVDKQSTFSRQLRHLSGAQSDGLVIDEDDEGDEDDDDSR